MNAWTLVRVVIIGAIGFWTQRWAAPVTLPWWVLAVYLLFPALLLPVIVRISMTSNRWYWRFPSWRRNPFAPTDPLENAHLAAFGCIACGIVWVFYALTRAPHPSMTRAPLPIALFFAGIGCWFGVRLCIVFFRDKLRT